MHGLREQKKQRTRRALVETAYALFERDGYEHTTVTAIAAAAEVSRATFFNYFPSKESLVFPDGDEILDAGLEVIARPSPHEHPADVLARALHAMIGSSRSGVRDPASALETRRLRLVMAAPALRAALLERTLATLETLADALRTAFPDELDDVEATAMVGAVFGAGLAAGSVSIQRGEPSEAALTRSVEFVTRALRSADGRT